MSAVSMKSTPSSSARWIVAIASLRLGAAAGGGEFGGDGAEVVEGAADVDEAVVQFVDGFGVLVWVVVVLVDAFRFVVDGGRARGRRCVVICRGRIQCGWCETSCVNPWCG
jgi:hypothetical protein